MPVAARATEVLADLGKAVRHQATSGLAFLGEDAKDSSSHWLAGPFNEIVGLAGFVIFVPEIDRPQFLP